MQLTSHVKVVHQGVKSFSCDECGNIFGYSSAEYIAVLVIVSDSAVQERTWPVDYFPSHLHIL